MQGPRNIIFIGVLKTLERSEWSVNWPGVQGPAVGPLVGSRGNASGGGPGDGAPGSSEVSDIWIQSDGLFWDLFVTLSDYKLIENWRK